MRDTEFISIQCPYCGEPFDAEVDGPAGSQEYVEDCEVCCQPVVLDVKVDPDNDQGRFAQVEVRREN